MRKEKNYSLILANKIGVDSGCKLIESLKFNTKLSTLNIGVNKLGVEGASKFGELLRNNTSLTNLIVEGIFNFIQFHFFF